MPRIGEPRPPAMPATDEQQGRRTAILRAAARLGRAEEIDRISAQKIAAEAGVALRTLYRYYPSKHHVFAAVLTAQIDDLEPARHRPADPVEAVAELMAQACRDVLKHKHLSHAMITSMQAVRGQSGATDYRAMRDRILAAAGIGEPTKQQVRIARLIEQVTFGVLTWTVSGELDPADAVADVRMACRRLIGDSFTHSATEPSLRRD